MPWNFPVTRRAAVALALALAATVASAQPSPKGEYQPQVGQQGKDVIWVPTPEALAEEMLRRAKVTPKDFVIDLGSGDGRIAITAAKKFNARARGIEYNPDMVALSKKNAEKAGVADKVEFIRADIFESDFSQATVITMYLLPALNLKLRPQLLDLKPGTRIVSHAFTMEDWKPDETFTAADKDGYLWLVPAKVAGQWELRFSLGSGEEKVDVDFDQKFQEIDGRVRRASTLTPLVAPKLSGADIRFAYKDSNGVTREFSGKVDGNRMEGVTSLPTGAKVRFTGERRG